MNQIDTFEAMLANGQDSEMLRYTLGNAYFKENRFDHAIDHLREAVRLKPDYSAAWRMLGRSLAAANQPQLALDAFDEGLRIAESNGDKQALKEMEVFRSRAEKQLNAAL
jgi:uncharacterized protein HemY